MAKTIVDLILPIYRITLALDQSCEAHDDVYDLKGNVKTLIKQVLPEFKIINQNLKTDKTKQALAKLQSANSGDFGKGFLHTLANVHGAFRLLKSALKQSNGDYLAPNPYSWTVMMWDSYLEALRITKVILTK